MLLDLGNKILEKANSWFLSILESNRYTRQLVGKLGELYLAGHSLEEGLETIKSYHEKGIFSIFDILGEEARTDEEANNYVLSYLKGIELFKENFSLGKGPGEKPVLISVKPSAICVRNGEDRMLAWGRDPLAERLEEIVSAAYARNIEVTLDMEDHNWTERTLGTAQKLWKSGYENLGIVLQSCLYRTKGDIAGRIAGQNYPFPKEKIRVRICRGIYREAKEIAIQSKEKAKELLVEKVGELFEAGVYVEIATHDRKVVEQIYKEIIVPKGIPKERYEWQFLKGVYAGEKIVPGLLKQGERVRFYMPVELKKGEGTAYMLRRLKGNPGLVFNGAKNMLEKVWGELIKER